MSKKANGDSLFGVLKGLRSQLAEQEKSKAEKLKADEAKRPDNDNDDELLVQAMAGVKRLDSSPSLPRKKPLAKPIIIPKNDDEEVLETLQDIVEWRAQDCSRLDLMKLQAGDFTIQAHLDLHGKNREEAKEALFGFFTQSLSVGYRCVNVICGRGLHTPGGKPVLKVLLVRWLVQSSLSYNVLAFASAKAHDGGVGAIYVLLRRNKRR